MEVYIACLVVYCCTCIVHPPMHRYWHWNRKWNKNHSLQQYSLSSDFGELENTEARERKREWKWDQNMRRTQASLVAILSRAIVSILRAPHAEMRSENETTDRIYLVQVGVLFSREGGGAKFSGKNGPPGPIFLKFWSPEPIFPPEQNFLDSTKPFVLPLRSLLEAS